MATKKNCNGEGSVYKYKSGYRGQIVIGIDESGRPIRRSVTGKTKREVNDKLTGIKNSLITGSYISPDRITICDLARIMIDDDYNLNYIKEPTYYRHIETLKRIEADPYLKKTPIQELTFIPIKQFLLSETHLSQSFIDKIYTMIQKTLKEAVKRKIILENPAADIKKPKTSQHREKVRALTVDEQFRLYKVLTTEEVNYSHQMLLSLMTGMRMGEINALKVEDVNLRMRTISINKTMSKGIKGEAFVSPSAKTSNGNRIIRISDTVMPLMKEIMHCCKGNEYLFMSKGKLINTSQVNMQFQRVIERYRILDKGVKGKVSLHSLRHAYATRCIEAGIHPKVLQHILGHSDISITLNTYCDAFDNFQNENLSKTDEYFANMGITFGNLHLLKSVI